MFSFEDIVFMTIEIAGKAPYKSQINQNMDKSGIEIKETLNDLCFQLYISFILNSARILSLHILVERCMLIKYSSEYLS